MSYMKFKATIVAPIVIAVSGCATIIGDPTQTVPITSAPSEATISVVDEAGTEVFAGKTPTSVTLHKSTGRYWGKKNYRVTITKEGYSPQVIPLMAGANGWYMFGNLLFGGLIGYFVVDPFNGNMYTLSPNVVAATMGTDTTKSTSAADGKLSIVLLQDVPEGLRDKLVRIQ